MPPRNTPENFGWVTKTFHWLTALLIITAIALGVVASRWGYDTSQSLETKAWLFSFHKTVGVTTFFVAVLRILWALTQKRPGLLNANKKGEAFLAETVHWLLYASLILVPIAGWVTHAASTGFAPLWLPFGDTLPLVPKSVELSEFAGMLHRFWEKILLVAVILHIAGALKHHVIDNDATLRRMWFGASDAPATNHSHAFLPPILAALIFAAVAGYAALASNHKGDTDAPALVSAPSDWSKQSGDIAITVSQFGGDIQGRFDDWTAQIAFDPDVEMGQAGDVAVTINIASLTLGQVTNEAKGRDYFHADDFPTATFAGPILRDGDGYRVDGTLTIKGTTLPLTLPFDLDLQGDTATMTAQTTIARLDYGIGVTQSDSNTLGFEVGVNLSLTAQNSAP